MGKRSSPSRGDDSRGKSVSRRSSGEKGGKKEQGPVTLLVRNIPHDCSYDLLDAFKKFGRIRDFYIPKDHYSGEPRGFAFIEFWDSRDASEAQRHMDNTMLCGREINVVRAAEKQKHHSDMHRRAGHRGHFDYKGRHLSRCGWSRACSRSPCRDGRHRSRSHSPAPRRRGGDYSASPKRKEVWQTKISGQSKEHDKGKKQGPGTPHDRSDRHEADNVSNRWWATPDYSATPKRMEEYQTIYPRKAKKHDEDKRQGSYTPADRNDCQQARDGHNERDDYSTSPKRKEERLAKRQRLSKEHDKKRRSYSRDDGNDCCDADMGLKVSNVHVDRKLVTLDGEESHAGWRSPRPSTRSSSRRQDDYSASAEKKEEVRAKSPKQSNEHEDNNRRSYTPDDRNDRCSADNCNKKRRASPDNGSPKRTEEPRQAQSQSQSNEHDNYKKQRSYTCDNRKDSCNADNGSKERNDYPASGYKKENTANLPRQSKDPEFTPDGRNDHHNIDNGSKERRDDNSAPRASGLAAPWLSSIPPPPPPPPPPRHSGLTAIRLPSQDQPASCFTDHYWDQPALRSTDFYWDQPALHPNDNELSSEEEVKFVLRLPPPRHSGSAALRLPPPRHSGSAASRHPLPRHSGLRSLRLPSQDEPELRPFMDDHWGQPAPCPSNVDPRVSAGQKKTVKPRVSSGEEEETFEVCLNIDDIRVEGEQIPCWSPHNSDYSKSDSPVSDIPWVERTAMAKKQVRQIMKKSKEKEERKRIRMRWKERKRKREENEERKRKRQKRKREKEERKRRKRKRDEKMETEREKRKKVKRRNSGRY